MPLSFYCKTCKKTMDESNFYSSYNLEKHPNGKLDECKKCCTMMVDNFNPDTFTHLLEDIDIPYIPEKWFELVKKYCKDPTKITGTTVLGRYISAMRLKQWRDYRYSDTEYLQNLESQKKRVALQQSGYSAQEIDQYMREMAENEQERPPLVVHESLAEAGQELYSQIQGLEAAPAPFMSAPIAVETTIELSDEDKKYLFLKWGAYRPEQWVKLEQMYEDFFNSYDIQSAGHIDTLKLICKTSLKANELIDLNDVEGYQKMSKVYDQLMKSGKFTALQNKGESNNFVDSVSELVSLCEEQGYIERFYIDEPNDMVDRVLQDTKKYLHTLVTEEMNLGNLVENAIKQIQEEENLKDSTDDELFEENNENIITEEDFEDFNEFIEEQRALSEEILEGEE